MKHRDEKNQRIDALRELMDRFEAPDLTLAEAQDLRGLMNALLNPEGRTDSGEPHGRTPSIGAEVWEDGVGPTVFSHCSVG